MNEGPLPTRKLARFVTDSRWADLPPAVRHEAVRAFVNWVGCAHGGAFHPAVETALLALAALSPGPCTVIGRTARLGPLDAALLNGLSAGAHGYDDAHVQTVIHPAAPTVAALLAHAEQHVVSGADFLHALVLSHELQCRLSSALAVAPARSHVGHYMTGLTGGVGVAAALGKLLGLSEQQLVWAMGIATMQGGGFRSSHGTMAAPFVPGLAGRAGLLAASLAAQGFTCHEEPLDGPNALLQVVGHPANAGALTEGLGAHWECMNVAIKPFPNACLIHAATDACLELTRAHRFSAADIERAEIQAHRLSVNLTGKAEPKDAFEAQVSLFHWAAAALAHGRAGLEEASEACVRDPAIVALRRRITATVADDLQPDEARATVYLRDGRCFDTEVRPYGGAAKRPLTDAQLTAKFMDQVTPCLGHDRGRALGEICWNLERCADVGRAAAGVWG